MKNRPVRKTRNRYVKPLSGVQLIDAERMRQQSVEGYEAGGDDEHNKHELSAAAACYVMKVLEYAGVFHGSMVNVHVLSAAMNLVWPWKGEHWKPDNTNWKRMLVKAGALIAADIDRLNRIEAQKKRVERITARQDRKSLSSKK